MQALILHNIELSELKLLRIKNTLHFTNLILKYIYNIAIILLWWITMISRLVI